MRNTDSQTLEPDQFPPLLKEIPDPPAKLYCRGRWPVAQNVFLTVVGSRKYSPYGRAVVEQLISGLSGYPVCIISGLALGIDALAHRAALTAGLSTIAVPGSGLDDAVLYPASNRSLAHKILTTGNTLLSELPAQTRASKQSFPSRNRIMAGLSQATLIIEATERSGTLITARLALEYNREVAAVPGSVFNLSSTGANRLIKEGAHPITTAGDLLRLLNIEERELTFDGPELTDSQKLVLACLTRPLTRDQLIFQTKLPFDQLQVVLTGLELKGLIRDLNGQVTRKDLSDI